MTPRKTIKPVRAGRLDTLMNGLAFLTLLAGAVASWQIQRSIAETEQLQRREEINTQARTVRDAFEVELGTAQSAVEEAANFANFQPALSARSWQRYAANAMQRFPQLRRLSWAASVRQDELPGYAARLEKLGVAGFALQGADTSRPVPQPRPSYLPLVYTHPGDTGVFGRDLFDRQAWAMAARTARDGGETVVIEQPPAGCGAGPPECLALLSASFADGRPEAISERRAQFQGVMIAVVDYGALMQEAVRRARAARLQLRVYDIGAEHRLVYADGPAPAGTQAIADEATLSVIAAGHAWEIVLHPLPAAEAPRWGRAAVGGGIGLACAVLLAGVMVAVGRGIRAIGQARSAAEAATQAKTDFLANMSHEIRTPMNAILGLAHLARKADPPPRQRDYLDKIESAADGLMAILNDILDLSKIEAGMLSVEQVPFDLAEVLDRLVQLFGMRAEAKGLGFDVSLPPELPRGLVGDPLRLGQILVNFCSNALKFTESGRVSVEVQIDADAPPEDGRVALRLAVTDTGIGLSVEQRSRLFASFAQADASTTRRYGGTGLGLAISKRLAGLMGGSVGVLSEPGQGSSFWVRLSFGLAADALPRKGRRDPPEPQALEQAARAQLSGRRFLLADDNEINQQVACEILADLGVSVVVAANGIEALAQVHEAHAQGRPFDAILMDMQMPDMDGISATQELRRDPRNQATPVFAMTANVMNEARQACLDAGMNDHLNKPLELPALFAALMRWLPPRPMDDIPPPQAPRAIDPPRAAALPQLPGLDSALGLARTGGKPQRYHDILLRFRDRHADLPERVLAALQAQDRDAAQRHAHTLMGLAITIGAFDLERLARRLESAIAEGPPDTPLDAWLMQIGPLQASRDAVLGAIAQVLETAY